MYDNTVQGRSQPFTTRSESFTDRSRAVPEPFQGVQEVVPETFTERSWTWRASRSGQKNRYGLEKTIASVGTLAFAFGLTLLHQPFQVQMIGYCLAAATVLLINPLDIIGRFLALGSRLLIATDFIFLSGLALSFSWPALLVFFLLLLISAALIYFCNRTWLAAYNWKNTEQVQKVLAADPEDLCSRSWQAHGKRELRTLMYQLGFAADDNALDIHYKPAYLLGYIHGVGKTKNINLLEMANEKNKELCKKQYKEIEQLKEKIDQLETEIDESTKELEEKEVWENKYFSQLRKIQELETANTELLEAIQDPDPTVREDPEQEKIIDFPEPERTTEEKVLWALSQGMSYREAGEYAGVSKTKAYNIKKAAVN